MSETTTKPKAAAGETSPPTDRLTSYEIFEVTAAGDLHWLGQFPAKPRTRRSEVIKDFLEIGSITPVPSKCVALPSDMVEPFPVKASTVTVLEVG